MNARLDRRSYSNTQHPSGSGSFDHYRLELIDFLGLKFFAVGFQVLQVGIVTLSRSEELDVAETGGHKCVAERRAIVEEGVAPRPEEVVDDKHIPAFLNVREKTLRGPVDIASLGLGFLAVV
jgi:hypothetical protein